MVCVRGMCLPRLWGKEGETDDNAWRGKDATVGETVSKRDNGANNEKRKDKKESNAYLISR